jgi:hypothetical protein
MADVNGDGDTDAVGFGLDGIYVAISTGVDFNPVSKWVSAFDQSHGWNNTDFVRTLADVDGDWKADAIGFGLDGVYVALSTGSSFGSVSRETIALDYSHGWRVYLHPRTFADVNGDGQDDAVGFGLDGVYVVLAK